MMNRVVGSSGDLLGDKYVMLEQSQELIETSGAFVAPMVGITQGEVDKVLEASGLPTIEDAARLPVESSHLHDVSGRIAVTDELMGHMSTAANELSTVFNGPVITRSSGKGDAVGVGIYESRIHGLHEQDIRSAFAAVVGSYFTEAATNYRSRLGLDSGFAVFMQPVVGCNTEAWDEWSYNESSGPSKNGLPVFSPLVSGNVKMGTARNPVGAVRMQNGFGSAVNTRSAHVIDLGTDEYDELDLQEVIFQYSIHNGLFGGRWDPNPEQGEYLVERDGAWAPPEEPERYGTLIYPYREGLFDFARLKQIFSKIHSAMDSPTYLEFALTNVDEEERLYIVQAAKLATKKDGDTKSIEDIRVEDIILDNINILAAATDTDPVASIIMIGSEDAQHELYEFDRTKEAEDGYILVYSARATMKRHKLDLRRLKNVKALIDVESMDWSHTAGTEEHLIGYSDQLGIPLLQVFSRGGHEWRALNGASTERGVPSDNRHHGRLSIRDGSFRVMIDPSSGKALVARST